MQDSVYELPRIHLLRLSEKGYEQHSDRGFGWYTEGEMYEKSLIGGPQGYAASASKAFRTVSPRRWVNKDMRKDKKDEKEGRGAVSVG